MGKKYKKELPPELSFQIQSQFLYGIVEVKDIQSSNIPVPKYTRIR